MSEKAQNDGRAVTALMRDQREALPFDGEPAPRRPSPSELAQHVRALEKDEVCDFARCLAGDGLDEVTERFVEARSLQLRQILGGLYLASIFSESDARLRAARPKPLADVVAVHESGHIVVGLALGRPAISVTLDRDAKSGLVRSHAALSTAARCRAAAAASLAGAAAVEALRPDAFVGGEHSDEDVRSAVEAINTLIGLDAPRERLRAEFEQAEALAAATVQAHRDHVQTVADALSGVLAACAKIPAPAENDDR